MTPEIARQVRDVESRLPIELPASWFEQDVAERMSEWIKKNRAAERRTDQRH